MSGISKTHLSVTKVGAVVLQLIEAVPQVLLVQPKPKPHTPHDLPPMGLPRGTRMYRDPSGAFVDADHDGRTQPPSGAVFEPVYATFLRELQEETGIHPVILEHARVVDLGAHPFASRTKAPYPIHWFGIMLTPALAAQVPLNGMQDSLYARWASLAELNAWVAEGKASAGYVAVAEMALQRMGLNP